MLTTQWCGRAPKWIRLVLRPEEADEGRGRIGVHLGRGAGVKLLDEEVDNVEVHEPVNVHLSISAVYVPLIMLRTHSRVRKREIKRTWPNHDKPAKAGMLVPRCWLMQPV